MFYWFNHIEQWCVLEIDNIIKMFIDYMYVYIDGCMEGWMGCVNDYMSVCVYKWLSRCVYE